MQNVCETLLPLMAKPGRIVNVCSVAGKERIIRKPELLQQFQARAGNCCWHDSVTAMHRPHGDHAWDL